MNNIPQVHKLSRASKLSLLAIVILLGAIFFTVNSSLQDQKAAGHASGSDCTIIAGFTYCPYSPYPTGYSYAYPTPATSGQICKQVWSGFYYTTQCYTPTPTPTPKPIATPAPTAAPVATTAPTSSASQTTTAGYQSWDGTLDSGNNNMISSTQITTGAIQGTAKTISIYIGNVNASPYNHVQVGMYADNGSGPGSLLTSSGIVTLKPNSWNTIPIGGITCVPYTKYWLGFNLDGANTQFGWSNRSAGNSWWKTHTFGSWQNPFGFYNDYGAKRYAIYLICGSGGTQPTPTQVPTSVPTALPTFSPTGIPTPIATAIPQPTDTPVPGSTLIAVDLGLHGIGNGGDSASPGSQGNMSPMRPDRTVTADVYDAQNQLVISKEGRITYDGNSGRFKGTFDLGTNFQTGPYTIKVKTDQYLRSLVPGIQTITAGQTNTLPGVTLIAGDINGDNAINIVDYNLLIGCYSDLLPATDCNATNNVLADLTDDGHVNQFDYNLFLRELTNIGGQ